MKNKNTKDITKKKRGFTLIELLAVIIILGILMIIAVPAVTKYITDSRKSSYISSAKNIIAGATTLANSESLDMTDEEITYYIPAKYIKSENGMKSPYGEFTEAYVGVVYEENNYRYFWVSNDTSKQGIKIITEKDNLDIDQIEGNLVDSEIRETVETTGIEDRNRILILNLDGTWQDERAATKNLNEDGELEPADTLLAIFATGEEFNSKIKIMSGNDDATSSTVDTNIQYIKRSKTEPEESNKQEVNIVSTTNSEVPIYAWFDNGTIYWWSEDIKPNMNSDASKMFRNLKGIKDIELKYLKTNLTNNMSDLFSNCINLEKLDVSKFDTSNVTSMAAMFFGLSKLKKLDLNSFRTPNVTNIRKMFCGMESLEQIDLSNFNTSNVTDMRAIFYNDKSLKKLDLSNFSIENTVDLAGMFYNTWSLKQLNISNFNKNKVKDMSFMFYRSGVEQLNIKNLDTSNVLNMSAMFYGAESLEQLDVSSFDTSNVNDMAWMFGCGESTLNCNLSNIIGLNKFDTSNVTSMQGMFSNQKKLRTLDLSSFNTPKLKTTSYMFSTMNLTTIYASPNFDVSGVTTSTGMFLKTYSGMAGDDSYVLTGGAGTTYNSSHVDKEYARIDDPANGRPGYFTLKNN